MAGLPQEPMETRYHSRYTDTGRSQESAGTCPERMGDPEKTSVLSKFQGTR